MNQNVHRNLLFSPNQHYLLGFFFLSYRGCRLLRPLSGCWPSCERARLWRGRGTDFPTTSASILPLPFSLDLYLIFFFCFFFLPLLHAPFLSLFVLRWFFLLSDWWYVDIPLARLSQCWPPAICALAFPVRQDGCNKRG